MVRETWVRTLGTPNGHFWTFFTLTLPIFSSLLEEDEDLLPAFKLIRGSLGIGNEISLTSETLRSLDRIHSQIAAAIGVERDVDDGELTPDLPLITNCVLPLTTTTKTTSTTTTTPPLTTDYQLVVPIDLNL